ncbi:kinase-like protein [Lentinula detonsa]|uniref:non-specific serine/threonine protein kinase n=1 Tax=Lentinula detonsa TaxID=2804962 RepID=A0AA38UVY4_9AGAR|nr:kinase-like protein [Lentinula detonsa]
MSNSSISTAALVPIDSEWRPIFHDSNQVVLYNPTSHALSIKPRPPCPYCKQPIPLGFESPFGQATAEHQASNYFHLLAIANESTSSPSTRASSPRTSPRVVEPTMEMEDARENNRGRTVFPAGTLAEGYFNAFFKEECKLGMGANGSVYLCVHMLDGNPLGHFAVKKIAVGESHSYLLNILREVRLLERLHHPNIITYHHAWLESSQFSSFGPKVPTLHLDDYIDVRLGREPRHGHVSLSSLSGSSTVPSPASLNTNALDSEHEESDLHSRSARIRAFRAFQRASPQEKERVRKEMQFQQSQSTSAPGHQQTWTPVHLLSAEEVHSLFRDVVEGLAFLHDRSILHLDLKPGNVLLTWDDGRGKMIPRAMLSDFGTSRDMLASSLNNRSGNTGTLEYTAPESLPSPVTGRLQGIDSKADMWSLGMVLHRMLFFKLPWRYSTDGTGPLNASSPNPPKVRRPPARDEAEKMDRLEEELLAYPGFRSTPALVEAFEGRKLPRAILVLLENLLNPVPSKRPTCKKVKSAVRDGMVGITSSSSAISLPPPSALHSNGSSSTTRSESRRRVDEHELNGYNEKHRILTDDDSQEDLVDHDAHEPNTSEGESDQRRAVLRGPAHSGKALLALPAPGLPETLRLNVQTRFRPFGGMSGYHELVTRSMKSFILIVKVFHLTAACECLSTSIYRPEGGGFGLATMIIAIVFAMADTWFDGLWSSVLFGLAHVVVVRIGCFYTRELC